MGEVRPVYPGAHGCDPDCERCRALRTSLLRALWEQDYAHLTEAQVAAGAGVAPAGFREHYPDMGALLEATYCEWDDRIRVLFQEALESDGHWSECLGDAVDAVFRELEDEPGALPLCEVAWGGPPSLRRRRAADRRHYVQLLVRRAPELPTVHAEFMIGALYRAAQEALASPDPDIGRIRRRAVELIGLLEPVPA